MAQTIDDCRAMIDAGRRSGAKLIIAYRLHFEEGTLEATEKVRSGELGKTRIFSSLFTQNIDASNHRIEADKWGWPVTRRGPVSDQRRAQSFWRGTHRSFRSHCHRERRRASRRGARDGRRLAAFSDESIAQFTVSYSSEAVSEYRVSGTQGDLVMTPGYSWEKGQTLAITVKGKRDETTFDKTDHFAGETKYFSDCVLDNTHPEPDGGEGLCDVCVIQAIEKSIASGQVEAIEQVSRKKRPARDQVQKLPASKPPELIDAKPADTTSGS